MSFPRFRSKRIGFLAAAQTFNDGTDVSLLTTNLFRKALASSVQYEVALGFSTLAKIATPDLSRELIGEVNAMILSSRPLIQRKAVICIFRLLQRYPDALTHTFPSTSGSSSTMWIPRL